MVQGPPADWYPDPLGRFTHRFWNGGSWTEHVALDGRQSVDPLVPTNDRATSDDTSGSSTDGGYIVIDAETTGLSASQHRIIELAIVKTDQSGRIVAEWVQRFNPGGPVGATHIHGISTDDVATAPSFSDLIAVVTERLSGGPVVAHNARFDLAFLRAEFKYAGWSLPWIPALCTLEASDHYLPTLDRRRLADCCTAARIRHDGAHSALGDARAVAGLLSHYLDARTPPSPRDSDIEILRDGAAVVWPTSASDRPSSPISRARVERRILAQQTAAAVPDLVDLLSGFSLVDALDEGAPAGSLAYLEKLAEALEDGKVTEDELDALDDVALAYSMSEGDRISANGGLLLALCHLALEDGKVSRAERAELKAVADLLNLPVSLVTDTLNWAEDARNARMSTETRPLPDGWTLGEPLRVGDKVVFTGCGEQIRADLESRAQRLGVRVLGTVSRKTSLLVTDNSFSGTKATAARELDVRTVHPDAFHTLLGHLQPALPRSRAKHARV